MPLLGGGELPVPGGDQIKFGCALDGGQDLSSIRWTFGLDVFVSQERSWFEVPARVALGESSHITSRSLSFLICKTASIGLTLESGRNRFPKCLV